MKSIGVLTSKTTYKPIIAIDWLLLQQTMHLVNSLTTECQWYHKVKRVSKDDSDTIVYVLTDLVIPKQTVSGAEVETDGEQMTSIITEVMGRFADKEKKEKHLAYNEFMSQMNCWVHSHVNMPVNPSGTDNSTWAEQVKTGFETWSDEPQIMMIFNKKDQCFTRVADPVVNMIFENVPLHVIKPEIDLSYVEDAIKNKIVKAPPPPVKTYTVPTTVPSKHSYHKPTPHSHAPRKHGHKIDPKKKKSALKKTQMGASSFARHNVLNKIFTPEEIKEIFELVDSYNRLSDPKLQEGVINNLTNKIADTLGNAQVEILQAQLFETSTECKTHISRWIHAPEEQYGEEATTDLNTSLFLAKELSANLIMHGIISTHHIYNAFNEKRIKILLDNWFDFRETFYATVKENTAAVAGCGVPQALYSYEDWY